MTLCFSQLALPLTGLCTMQGPLQDPAEQADGWTVARSGGQREL